MATSNLASAAVTHPRGRASGWSNPARDSVAATGGEQHFAGQERGTGTCCRPGKPAPRRKSRGRPARHRDASRDAGTTGRHDASRGEKTAVPKRAEPHDWRQLQHAGNPRTVRRGRKNGAGGTRTSDLPAASGGSGREKPGAIRDSGPLGSIVHARARRDASNRGTAGTGSNRPRVMSVEGRSLEIPREVA